MTNEQKYKQLIAEIAANVDEAEEVEIGDPRVKKKPMRGISKVEFKNLKPDSQVSTDAMNIVSKISRDAEDFPKRAIIGKMLVNNDAKQGEMLVFRIDFETIPSFVATVKTNPSDLTGSKASFNIDKLPVDTYAVTVKMKGKEAEDKEMFMSQMKDLVPNFKFKKDIEQPLETGDGTLTLKSTEPIKNTKEKEKKEKEKFLKKDLAYQSPATRRGFSKGDPDTSFLGGSKTITKVAKSSQSPAIVRSVKEEEEQSFGAIKKRKSPPVVSAGFLGKEDSNNPTFDKGQRSFSKFQKIDTIDWLKPLTKDLISSFLRKLGMENIKETDTENSKDMKKDFKQKIAEIAAKIAGINEEYDAGEMELPSGILTRLNSSISNYSDLAKAMNDIMGEIIAKEPGMQDLETKSGWNVIYQKLDQLSGEKKAGGDVPPEVPSADQEKLPALQESFNRINRK